ncbi:MAG: isopentenyl phosphate kinase family protein [Candidatus Odinarchaeota archaeon]|nr:isopentenyl phosphate kinase family protein [Candidatus Odinarchaeota archaeon]
MDNLAIIKIGGSVFSDKKVPFSFRKDVVARLSQEIKSFEGSKIIVHGGGSFGHVIAKEYDVTNPNTQHKKRYMIGIINTHYAMRVLNSMFIKIFVDEGIPVLPFDPLTIFVLKKNEVIYSDTTTLELALKRGFVPILYGDIVIDEENVFSILSGDTIISHLASKMNPKSVILCTDVDGVYENIEDKETLIREINEDNISEVLEKLRTSNSGASVIDVTGGMYKKIKELWNLAKKGVVSYIVNGLKPSLVKMAFEEKSVVGTKIVCNSCGGKN